MRFQVGRSINRLALWASAQAKEPPPSRPSPSHSSTQCQEQAEDNERGSRQICELLAAFVGTGSPTATKDDDPRIAIIGSRSTLWPNPAQDDPTLNANILPIARAKVTSSMPPVGMRHFESSANERKTPDLPLTKVRSGSGTTDGCARFPEREVNFAAGAVLAPVAAIERPVLDRLGDVPHRNGWLGVEVSDGARNLENAGRGRGRSAPAAASRAEQALGEARRVHRMSAPGGYPSAHWSRFFRQPAESALVAAPVPPAPVSNLSLAWPRR